MSNTLRARVKCGMLELLEKVDLPEGTEVMVTILHVPSSEDREAFRRDEWMEAVAPIEVGDPSARINIDIHGVP
jgi:predicted DNA-binding antitoxin AbrB/MazE fold protein